LQSEIIARQLELYKQDAKDMSSMTVATAASGCLAASRRAGAKQVVQEDASEQRTAKFCKDCGGAVEQAFKFCKFCGCQQY
jgi:hypothetical protein